MGSNTSRPSYAPANVNFNSSRATTNLSKLKPRPLPQGRAQVLRGIIPAAAPAIVPPPGTPSSSRNHRPPPPVTATPPQPPNWQKYYDETLMSLSTHKTFPLDKSTKEYRTIAELIHPLQVTSIERVVNPDLWERYIHARKEMLRAKSDDLCLLSELGFSETEVMRRAHLSLNFNKDSLLTSAAGTYSPNETLLFHCTKSRETLTSILGQGLDERLGRVSGALLGKGIYFSDNPAKSIKYDGTGGNILIFTVLLGDCLSADHLPSKDFLVREPRKTNGRQKRNFNDLHFDSITARPDEEHNEYVIYNRNQCCPLYKVKYEEPEIVSLDDPLTNYDRARKFRPTIAWRKVAGRSILEPSMPNQALDGEWPFFASTLFKEMSDEPSPGHSDSVQAGPASIPEGSIVPADSNTDTPPESDDDEDNYESFTYTSESENSSVASSCKALDLPTLPVGEECQICFDSPGNWKQLKCEHKLCPSCYDNIKTRRTTMLGIPHTHVRCPFCKAITGTLVGTCPDGVMIVTVSSKHCKGYSGYKSYKIFYEINTGTYFRSSIAHLPKNPEGKRILNLLRTAWDRRLIFSIGNSISTGQQNVLVWNIHHKTALRGGVLFHGYPDWGYLKRVKAELKDCGVDTPDFISIKLWWGQKARFFLKLI